VKRYFVTEKLNEALDADAHNSIPQKMLKHPGEEKWAVLILDDNRYMFSQLSGYLIDELTEDWYN